MFKFCSKLELCAFLLLVTRLSHHVYDHSNLNIEDIKKLTGTISSRACIVGKFGFISRM